MNKLFSFLFVLAAQFTILVGVGRAYTAVDYYNAGLQLYNAQNYSQAIQYFSAAISLDPNNTSSLQGRANCYYTQGQYSLALADYQKVQSITPSDALAQMIQSLQAKVGAGTDTTNLPPPNPPGAAAGPSSFDQGVSLYQQKQYPQAIPFFQQAVQENPGDGKSYYYLGLSQVLSGQSKEACVNLTLSDQKLPNPQVKQYADQLKAQLSPEDQTWMDGQLAASASVQSMTVAQAPVSNTRNKSRKRLYRISPFIALFNLTDFENSAESYVAAAKELQLSDPNIQESGSVPTMGPGISLEVENPLLTDLDWSFQIGLIDVGTANDTITNNGSFTLNDSYNMFLGECVLSARYYLGAGDMQPWVSAGPLLDFANISNYTFHLVSPGGNDDFKGPFNGFGFGGQAQLGMDFKLSDSFFITAFAGYQLASVGNLNNTINNSNVPGVAQGSTVTLEVVPTSTGKVIVPVSNGILCVPTIDQGAGSSAPAGSRPAVLDNSGPFLGASVAFHL